MFTAPDGEEYVIKSESVNIIMSERWKIYLDDVRTTPDGFTHTCRWPEDVISLLQEAESKGIVVERVSLDHDLGEFNCTHNRTGYDVLVWIEEQVHVRNFVPPVRMDSHSDNAPAKDRMRAALRSIYQYCDKNNIVYRR